MGFDRYLNIYQLDTLKFGSRFFLNQKPTRFLVEKPFEEEEEEEENGEEESDIEEAFEDQEEKRRKRFVEKIRKEDQFLHNKVPLPYQKKELN